MSHQLSAGWFQERAGFCTGSHANDLLDFTAKGLPGAKRKTYFRTKIGELLTGNAIQEGYVSPEMLSGIEREPLARTAYELQEGVMIEEVEFVKHPTVPRAGGSCDGFVGEDGIIEIKCGKIGTHIQWVLDGKVPEEHLGQINFYLWVTGRAWCDFVAFNPEVPKPLQLMVIRHQRDESAIARIEAAVADFNAQIDDAIERLRAIVGPFDLPAAEQAKVTPEDPAMAGAYLQDSDFEGLV
jgi:hypothetical protein